MLRAARTSNAYLRALYERATERPPPEMFERRIELDKNDYNGHERTPIHTPHYSVLSCDLPAPSLRAQSCGISFIVAENPFPDCFGFHFRDICLSQNLVHSLRIAVRR
jgi:hypothetical protein